MRYVVSGLFTEGATDKRFLTNIIYRTMIDAAIRYLNVEAEIQEYINVYTEKTNDERIKKICSDKDVVDIFFIHADASTNQYDKISEIFVSAVAGGCLGACEVEPERIIPTITVREMEAWALSDPNAIARACGFAAWPDHIERSWEPGAVEQLEDPKSVLNHALRSLFRGRGKHKYAKASLWFEQIGNEIDLNSLKGLRSFSLFYSCIQRYFEERRL